MIRHSKSQWQHRITNLGHQRTQRQNKYRAVDIASPPQKTRHASSQPTTSSPLKALRRPTRKSLLPFKTTPRHTSCYNPTR
eukprot:5832279-Lingulodinium_polyedra.AAC.1